MAYEFKKLSDVEVIVEPSESANVIIEEDGVIKKTSMDAICNEMIKRIPSAKGGSF